MSRDAAPGCVLAIDAGGTFFKSALVDPGGALLTAPAATPVDSGGSAEAILDAYSTIIADAFAVCDARGLELSGLGVSTPGPFDYSAGESRMAHKFRALLGLDLFRALRARQPRLAARPIRFLHDGHAFVLGEHWRGAARGFDRVAGVTLGTGVGFGCVLDGRIHDDGAGGPCLSLFRTPFGDGILEDFVSRRGITRLYRQAVALSDAHEIEVAEIGARALKKSEPAALAAFAEAGHALAANLRAPLTELGIECLVLGGQIAKSFAAFAPALREGLVGLPSLRVIRAAEAIDTAPLLGAARYFASG